MKKTIIFAILLIITGTYLYKSKRVHSSKYLYYMANDTSHEKLSDEQILNELTIIIPSCDKYSELWDITTKLLLKNWQNLDTKYSSIPIYLISNYDEFHHPRVINLKLGEDKSWSDNMITALKHVKTKYVMLILDDYIINSQVNEQRIIELIRLLDRTHAPYIQILPHNPSLIDGPTIDGVKNVIIRNRRGHFRTSLQICIWNKDDLRDLLVPGESAWDFEVEGSRRTRVYLRPFLWLTDKPVITYLNAVHKGVYEQSVVEYINQQGFNFHPKKMPIDLKK